MRDPIVDKIVAHVERVGEHGVPSAAGAAAKAFIADTLAVGVAGISTPWRGEVFDMLAAIATRARYRVVSREFRMPNDAANKQMSQRRLDSLRAALQKRRVDVARFVWQPLGSATPPRPIESEIQRVLYSTVELQP